MTQRLVGRNVAITGGAGDIGRAMGLELASCGANVTLIDTVPRHKTDWRMEHYAGLTGRVEYVQGDVRDRARLDEVLATIDRLDIAIGNAGIVRSAPFLDIAETDWHQQLDINLTGTFHLTQSAARLMVSNGTRGHIILTGSWIGEVPWPEVAAYSTTKGGLRMLARAAARELGPYGVRVNVVAPGIVQAGLAKHQMETEPQYARRAAKVIPLGQPQTAEQVAQVTAFLCSEDAAYMTGSVLLADGGCSLFQFDQ